MIIHKVKFQNFKSYTQETLIDFDKVKGVWEISGPVGSGKSSICEAIIYTLYGKVKGKSYKDLITWGQKHGYTEIWITSRGKELHIKRELNAYGQSPVYIWIDGQEKIFSDKRNIQQELLDNYIEIPQMMMEEMYMISFDNFKPIASMSAKDLRGFLNNVLGLSIIDDKINKIKSYLSDINQQISNERSIISELELQKKPIHIATDHQQDIKLKQEEIAQLDARLKSYIDETDKKLSQICKQRDDEKRNMDQIMALGKAKRKEINLISKGICPTCGAKINPDKIIETQNELNILLHNYGISKKAYDEFCVQAGNILQEKQDYYNKYDAQRRTMVNEINSWKIEDAKQSISQDAINQIESRIQEHIKTKEDIEIKRDKINVLLDIFYDKVYPKVINYIIVPINKSMNDMCAIMGLSYIPQLDNAFHCSINRDNIDNTPVSSLSTGQRKTIDIIMILSIMLNISSGYNYNLIWLDELFSNFDTDSRHRMISMIKSILDKDKTCVIISHQPIQGTLKDGDINLTNDREGTKISFIRYEQ